MCKCVCASPVLFGRVEKQDKNENLIIMVIWRRRRRRHARWQTRRALTWLLAQEKGTDARGTVMKVLHDVRQVLHIVVVHFLNRR